MKFDVGDRVEALRDYPQGNENILRGWTGTVVKVDGGYPPIGVRWDNGNPKYGQQEGDARLHDCHGSCEDGYGWFVYTDDICILEEVVSEDFDVSSDDIFAMIGGCV